MENIQISAWNMRSIRCAAPYVQELVKNEGSDILCLSEHRLYNHELHKLTNLGIGYEFHGKASSDLEDRHQSRKVGHCGVAIMWSKDIAERVKVIECNSDRICIIEVIRAIHGRSLFIFSVYLPQQQCKISSFSHHLEVLAEMVNRCKLEGEILIIGDTNCHFGVNVGDRFNGVTTKNAKAMLKMVKDCDLHIIDSSKSVCSGPCYTYYVPGVGSSYIDHCMASTLAAMCISKCEILEDCIQNTSDHLPIKVTIQDSHKGDKDRTYSSSNTRIAWNKITKEEIETSYTYPLTQKLKPIEEYLTKIGEESTAEAQMMIEIGVEKITNAILSSCQNLPKTKYNKHLKPYWNKTLTVLNNEKEIAWNSWKKKEEN